MGVKDQFLHLGKFQLRDDNHIRFWQDKALGDQPLKFEYPRLYNIVHMKQATIANILSTLPFNVSFRRIYLWENKLLEWKHFKLWL